MITKTEVQERPNGDVLTIEYNENGAPVKMDLVIKKGGRLHGEILNPERWPTAIDRLYKHIADKMHLQSDEGMRVFDEYAARKRSQMAADAKKQSVV